MSETWSRSRQAGRLTKRERAELQSQAARERQSGAAPGVVSRAVAYLRKPPADAEVVVEPAHWRTILALVLSIAGLGVATYLTIAHYDSTVSLVCSGGGIVNCERVTTSAQSVFLGVPVALWGFIFFLGMVAVNLPVAWRSGDRRVHALRLAMSVLGMCFVLYLVSAELLIIKNICLWCTSVHAITFVLFVLMITTVPQMLGWGASATRSSHGWTH